MTTPRSVARTPRFISRQLAIGFGAVSLVAITMCAMLLGVILQVSGLVASMRRDEDAIRRGLDLATAVRELSIHIAHTVIEADDSHLEHYETWRQQVERQIAALANRIPEPERYRIQLLAEAIERMHDLLVHSALPAARRGDSSAVRAIHRDIEVLGKQAAVQADAIAVATTSQMAHAHVLATASTRLGLVGGGLCVTVILALSIGFTWRLRALVLTPLLKLTEAARHFGSGDFAVRVGRVGRGELAALGEAFDRMADELARRETRLLQSERMAVIGQLAAGVAHELNNPIGIIRGYLKTMTPDGDAKTLAEELAILDEEAAHCQRIAEDLLSYARTVELSSDVIQTADFLRSTAKRFDSSSAAAARGSHVSVVADEATIRADGARLRQVLLNLLANACQASPPDTTVNVRGRVTATGYEVEVEDQGSGIEPGDEQRIFEPFFSKRQGGSGLGLAVCDGIIKAHGGTIDVRRAASGGAIFRIVLPTASAADVAVGASSNPYESSHV